MGHRLLGTSFCENYRKKDAYLKIGSLARCQSASSSFNLVMELCAGPQYPAPAVSYPPPVRLPTQDHDGILTAQTDIDTSRIEAICTLNRQCTMKPHSKSYTTSSEENGVGLYILPSMLDHSYVPTAWLQPFGDLVVVRAISDLAKGEEVTVTYLHETVYPYFPSFILRAQELMAYFARCDCILCHIDRQDGVEAFMTRDKELARLWRDVTPSGIARVIEVLAATYHPERGILRPEIFLHTDTTLLSSSKPGWEKRASENATYRPPKRSSRRSRPPESRSSTRNWRTSP